MLREYIDALCERVEAATVVMAFAVAVVLIALLASCDRKPVPSDEVPPPVPARMNAPPLPEPTRVRVGDIEVTTAAGTPVLIENEGDASGVGHGVRSSSDEVVASMDLSAPIASRDHATGGSIKYALQLTGGDGGAVVVWVLCAVFLGVGAFTAYRGNVKLGAYIAACGPALVGGCVLVEKYPWLFLLAAGLALAGIAWYVIWSLRLSSALGSVVAGVETSPDGVAEIVKTNIGKFSTPAVKATIRAQKAKEGIV